MLYLVTATGSKECDAKVDTMVHIQNPHLPGRLRWENHKLFVNLAYKRDPVLDRNARIAWAGGSRVWEDRKLYSGAMLPLQVQGKKHRIAGFTIPRVMVVVGTICDGRYTYQQTAGLP